MASETENSDYEQLQRQVQQLEEKLKENEQALTTTQSHKDALIQNKLELERQLDALREATAHDQQALEAQIQALQKQLQERNQTLAERDAQYEQLQREREQLLTSLEQLKQALQEATDGHDSLQQKIQELLKKIESQRDELAHAQSEREKLHHQIEMLEQRVNDMTIGQADAEQQMKNVLEQLATAEREREHLSQERAELVKVNEAQHATLSKQQSDVERLTNEVTQLQRQIEQLQTTGNGTTEQIVQLQEEKRQLEEELDSAEQRCQQSEQLLQQQQEQIKTLASQLRDQQTLTEELQRLKKKLETLKGVQEQLKQTEQVVEQTKEALQQKDEALQQVSEKLKQAQEKEQLNDEEIQKLKQQIDMLTKERNELQTKNESLTEEKKDLERRVTKLTEENRLSNETLQKLEKQLTELESEKADVGQQLKDQIVEYEKRVESFNQEITKLKEELTTQQNQATSNIEELKNQLSTAEATNNTLQLDLQVLQGNLAQALKNAKKILEQTQKIAQHYPNEVVIQKALQAAEQLTEQSTLVDFQHVNEQLLDAIKQAQQNEVNQMAERERQAREKAIAELKKLKERANDVTHEAVIAALEAAGKVDEQTTSEELERMIHNLRQALAQAAQQDREEREREQLQRAKGSLTIARSLAATHSEDEKVKQALSKAEQLGEGATIEQLYEVTDALLQAIYEAEEKQEQQSKEGLWNAILLAKQTADSYSDDEGVVSALQRAKSVSEQSAMRELHDVLAQLQTAIKQAQVVKEQQMKDKEKRQALQKLQNVVEMLQPYAEEEAVYEVLERATKLGETSSLRDIHEMKDELLDVLAQAMKQSKLATAEQKERAKVSLDELGEWCEDKFLAPSVRPSEQQMNEWRQQLQQEELLLTQYDQVVRQVKEATERVTANIEANQLKTEQATEAITEAKNISNKLQEEKEEVHIQSLLQQVVQKINEAQVKVNDMTDELRHKSELQQQLNEIVVSIAPEAVRYVDHHLTRDTLERVNKLIALMPNSENKTTYENELQKLENILQTVEETFEAVQLAQQTLDEEKLQQAREKLEQLKLLDTKYVTEQTKAHLQQQLDRIEVALQKEQMRDQLEEAKNFLMTIPVSEDGQRLFDTEHYVNALEKKALEDAIEKLEAADTTGGFEKAKADFEKAMKPYTDSTTKKYGKRNEALEKATAAVKKAEASERQADVDEARALVEEIKDERYTSEKNDLTTRLDNIKVTDITLLDLKNVLAQAKEAQTTNQHQQENYPEGIWQALQTAITQGEEVVTNAGQVAETTISEQITKATEALEQALHNLIIPVKLPSTTTVEKAPFDLTPKVKQLEKTMSKSDYQAKFHKTTGGLLSLNLGIVDLGLLSSGQVSSISQKDKHEITVAPNTTFTGKVRVSMSGVAGSQQVKVHTYKELPNGDYKKIATRSGVVATLLGAPIPTYLDLGTLEEGKYVLLLEPGAGVALGTAIPFQIQEATIYDYSESAVNAQIEGNIFNQQGAQKGQDAEHSIIRAVTGGLHDNVTLELSQEGETEIQGKYGKLYVTRDGAYRYQPESNRQNIGRYEEFTMHAMNTKNGSTDDGLLRIVLDHDTIEWDATYEQSKVVKAVDDQKKTTIQLNPVKTIIKGTNSDGNTPFISHNFAVQDTHSKITFELSKSRSSKEEVTVDIIDAETNLVVHQLGNSTITSSWKKYEVSHLPKGNYRVSVNAQSQPRVYIQNIQVESIAWGEYELPYTKAQEVSGNFRTLKGNYLGANESKHEDTLLYVKGYDVMVDDNLDYLTFKVDERGQFEMDKNGELAKKVDSVRQKGQRSSGTMYVKTGDTQSFHRIETNIRNKKESTLTVIAGEYGVLEIETNGDYTYKPYNRIESVGQTEVFEYQLVHPSGNVANATLQIQIEGIDTTPERPDSAMTQRSEREAVERTQLDFTYENVEVTFDSSPLAIRTLPMTESNIPRDEHIVTLYVDRDERQSQSHYAHSITLLENFSKGINLSQIIENSETIY